MHLTRRQRYVLEQLASDDPDVDLTESGGQVWLGLEQTSKKLLNFLLRNILVSVEYESGDYHSYRINEWGLRVLSDPDFEPQLELARLMNERQKMKRRYRKK